MMNSAEISAFAAYAEKKKKRKRSNDISPFKNKTEPKLKKKKKSRVQNDDKKYGNVCLIDKHKEKYSNGLNNEKINRTPEDKEKIVESLLNAQLESIFHDENVASKINSSSKKNFIPHMQNHDFDKNLNEKRKVQKNKLKSTKSKIKKKSNEEEIKELQFVQFREKTQVPNDVQPFKKNLEKCQKKIEISPASDIYAHSAKIGEGVLSWLLSPMKVDDFFDTCWENKPLHISKKDENFFKCICTLKDFKHALKENDLYFTKNIDVTSYVDGVRSTENLDGKATLPVIWDFLNEGKSIRLLNPQTFIQNVRLLNSSLQEFFHCFVGANLYLTPAGTQGFAPHYDDIDAFVLQLEGEKCWKLYNSRRPEEILPRESSRNFREDEIGNPIMEVVLKPGDLLYFPRGLIHQARCLPHVHSLHLTVSCYQKTSWADLFEKIIPVALQEAISEDVEFRKGLPIGYLKYMGMMYSDDKSHLREEMQRKFKALAERIIKFCPLDAGIDQMGVDFMHGALPPFLTLEEKLHGADRNVRYQNKNFLDALKHHSDRNLGVKLIRATCARLVSEGDAVYLYYTTDNSLVYRENEVSSVEIPVTWTVAIEHLIRSYPDFVDMKSLTITRRDDKPGKWRRIAEFVYFMWQRGLVMFDKPHQAIYS